MIPFLAKTGKREKLGETKAPARIIRKQKMEIKPSVENISILFQAFAQRKKKRNHRKVESRELK